MELLQDKEQDKEIAEYLRCASDVRSIESMLATHLGIWVGVNTFWGTLVWFAFTQWGEQAVSLAQLNLPQWFVLLVFASFAFSMNLALNFSVAALTARRKKYRYIRKELREKLKKKSRQIEKLVEDAEEEKVYEAKKDWYERQFARLAWVPRKLYQIVGLCVCFLWGGLTLLSVVMSAWAIIFGPG